MTSHARIHADTPRAAKPTRAPLDTFVFYLARGVKPTITHERLARSIL